MPYGLIISDFIFILVNAKTLDNFTSLKVENDVFSKRLGSSKDLNKSFIRRVRSAKSAALAGEAYMILVTTGSFLVL